MDNDVTSKMNGSVEEVNYDVSPKTLKSVASSKPTPVINSDGNNHTDNGEHSDEEHHSRTNGDTVGEEEVENEDVEMDEVESSSHSGEPEENSEESEEDRSKMVEDLEDDKLVESDENVDNAEEEEEGEENVEMYDEDFLDEHPEEGNSVEGHEKDEDVEKLDVRSNDDDNIDESKTVDKDETVDNSNDPSDVEMEEEVEENEDKEIVDDSKNVDHSFEKDLKTVEKQKSAKSTRDGSVSEKVEETDSVEESGKTETNKIAPNEEKNMELSDDLQSEDEKEGEIQEEKHKDAEAKKEGKNDEAKTKGKDDEAKTEGKDDETTEGKDDEAKTEGKDDEAKTEGKDDEAKTEENEDEAGTEGKDDEAKTEGKDDEAKAEGKDAEIPEEDKEGEAPEDGKEAEAPRRSGRKRKEVQRFELSDSHEKKESTKSSKKKHVAETIDLSDDSDIQEVKDEDPLLDPLADPLADPLGGGDDADNNKKSTVIVNDAKSLSKLANERSVDGKGKKPTLVIIDTNSILSGKGPVAISQQKVASTGTSIIPTSSTKPTPKVKRDPNVNDDTVVIEAPSFIVPYVYENPPKSTLKELIKKIKEAIEEEEAKEREEKEKAEKEKAEKEKAENEKAEKEKEENDKADEEKSENEESDKKSSKDKEEDKSEEEDKKKETDEKKSEDTEKKSDTADGDAASAKKGDSKETGSSESKPTEETKSVSKIEARANHKKSLIDAYFEGPIAKFLSGIGMGLVQEHVQTDLLKIQKRKADKDRSSKTRIAIQNLIHNLEESKENNAPFTFTYHKCEFCTFKTESLLVMARHLETPHMYNYIYRCNFCPHETRGAQEILFHMEAEHNVRGRLDRAPLFFQCNMCPFEDNSKGKLTRHMVTCHRRFKPDTNQAPTLDWEPPAKIMQPLIHAGRGRPSVLGPQFAPVKTPSQMFPHLLPKPSNLTPQQQQILASHKMGLGANTVTSAAIQRGRGRPVGSYKQDKMTVGRGRGGSVANMMYSRGGVGQPQVYIPTSNLPLGANSSQFSMQGNQIYQVMTSKGQLMPVLVTGGMNTQSYSAMSQLSSLSQSASSGSGPTPVALVPNLATSSSLTIQSTTSNRPSSSKQPQQPSISITPLPKAGGSKSGVTVTPTAPPPKPGQPVTPGQKQYFVICEICDGYIKDLDQLRNHMQWIHKVKIHPKMIYNRPPLNCQKCQFRFFTDQGLERHLLGTHGLVTSSMQEAANKGQDSGRCPLCGKVYQWKLLNHVSKDHRMSLKPAHLSYKCTVCTATFNQYKLFENHVYTAHSTVAKKVLDAPPASKPKPVTAPLKINDEITIIPQPSESASKPSVSSEGENPTQKKLKCHVCGLLFSRMNVKLLYSHYLKKHSKECQIELDRASDPKYKSYLPSGFLEYLKKVKQKRGKIVPLDTEDDVTEVSEENVPKAGREVTITKVTPDKGSSKPKIEVIEIEDSPAKALKYKIKSPKISPKKKEKTKRKLEDDDGDDQFTPSKKIREQEKNENKSDGDRAERRSTRVRRSMNRSYQEDPDSD